MIVQEKRKGEPISTKPEPVSKQLDSDLFMLNMTVLEPGLRHATIFRHFDELSLGGAFQILNDHDPQPLYYQLIAERGNIFTWEYIEKGPEWWHVEIRKNGAAVTVGELAAGDARKAAVLKKHGIDFCCGGKKTLQQVCDEQRLDAAGIEAELEGSLNAPAQGADNAFDRWQPDFLADYIYNQHHTYYYQEGPVIADLCDKVAARHGDHFPNLHQVKELYTLLQGDLRSHFLEEEKVVFPFIKALVLAKRTGDLTAMDGFPSISEPVQMMEADHEAAGAVLVQIRKAANGFQTPEGACSSFQLLYQKLSALEADLHQHIHLENNILFPKAMKLEKEVFAAL